MAFQVMHAIARNVCNCVSVFITNLCNTFYVTHKIIDLQQSGFNNDNNNNKFISKREKGKGLGPTAILHLPPSC